MSTTEVYRRKRLSPNADGNAGRSDLGTPSLSFSERANISVRCVIADMPAINGHAPEW